MPRPTVAEINQSALEHNWRSVQQVLQGTPVCAIVKADAYGHGAQGVAKVFSRLGGHCWGVHSVEEALGLRESGIEGTVIVLGGVYPDEADAVVRKRLTPAIYDLANLQTLVKAFSPLVKHSTQAIHLKLDTGMGRIGVRAELLKSFLAAFREQKVFSMTGVFAHLPQAENRQATMEQKGFFDAALAVIQKEGFSPGLRHHSNSIVAILYPEMRYDLVRPGLILYGVYPHALLRPALDLQPVMSFVSRIISIRDIPAGVGLSYAHTFTTSRPSRIATLPVGYADGYPRACSNQASVLLHGKRAKIVGRVCMDMSLVDVTDIPQAKVGDRVVLFGIDGKESLPVEEIAQFANTIPYEVFCGISPRVPRIMVDGAR